MARMTAAPSIPDPSALAVTVVTDGRGDLERVVELVAAAVDGGARAVQLREPSWSARSMAIACERVRPRLHSVRGLLLVNDRADVVAAGLADGVQLGHRSLSPDAVRPFLPAGACIGFSAHDATQTRLGQSADFVILAPLFATACKPDVAPLGLRRAAELITASAVPVVLLGGIDAGNAAEAREIGSCGVAVMSAVCDATDPRSAAAALRSAWEQTPR